MNRPEAPLDLITIEATPASGESLSRVQFWHFLVTNLEQRGLPIPLFSEN
jgi:hypothetical protein